MLGIQHGLLGKDTLRRYLRRHFVTAFLFLVCGLPALAAAEVTLEQPVPDLRLALNEPVAVQFPQGMTDHTRPGAAWAHIIRNRPNLPAGLSFDPATRTLSGTPTAEHDATHSYRVVYRWGRGADNFEHLIVPFRLVVAATVQQPPAEEPDIEITLEYPLSDIALVVNEPVAVQFPQGMTDHTRPGAAWAHIIRNRPNLPAGLSFDPATRTLSGTPTAEHDATHSYRVVYRWGRGADNFEHLIVPFRLVVTMPTNAHIDARIRAFMNEARSVSQFVQGLPNLHKSRALYMVASQAGDADFVSEEHPRMLSFGADARTIFSWGSNPASPRYDQVEFVASDEQKWHFGVIDFAEDPPAVNHDIQACQTCHNGHPLWAQYPVWPGTLFEITSDHRSVRPASYDQALLAGFQQSSDSRLSEAGAPPPFFGHKSTLPWDFANQLAIRHGQVLANWVIARPDFYELARRFVCGDYGSTLSYWPREVVALHLMGTAGGELVPVDPNDEFAEKNYSSSNATTKDVFKLLIINHLYEIDPEIQALYDRTSNTGSVRGSYSYHDYYLHFAPGTATAADELLSRLDLVELLGQDNINRRRTLSRVNRDRDMVLGAGHLEVMAPRVCEALQEED